MKPKWKWEYLSWPMFSPFQHSSFFLQLSIQLNTLLVFILKKDKLFCHIHLLFQNELEEASENLSQMVARNYLRTPRTKIIQAAHLTKRKRYEFLSAVSKGFLPPDVSSDSPQRRRRTSSSWSYQTWDDDSGDEVRPWGMIDLYHTCRIWSVHLSWGSIIQTFKYSNVWLDRLTSYYIVTNYWWRVLCFMLILQVTKRW